MDNIKWSNNTNWVTDDQLVVQTKVLIKDNRQKLSPEEIIELKNELSQRYFDLMELSNSFYNLYSSKELYDSIVTLNSARKSLISINI
jgi:predicted metal-binding transcription factor (methanogenesis marker protein 9)